MHTPDPNAVLVQAPPSGSAPAFALDERVYAPGAPITITFAAPVPSPSSARAWVTVIEANAAPDRYGDWKYVDDHSRSATLAAPRAAGAYQVRLHTDYPTHTTNMRRAVDFTVGQGATLPGETPRASQRFHLSTTSPAAGAKLTVSFDGPLVAAKGEQFWIATAKAGDPDTSYGKWEYVPPAAKTMQFEVPSAPGDYELRLHANYPTQSTNVVFRARLHIQ